MGVVPVPVSVMYLVATLQQLNLNFNRSQNNNHSICEILKQCSLDYITLSTELAVSLTVSVCSANTSLAYFAHSLGVVVF